MEETHGSLKTLGKNAHVMGWEPHGTRAAVAVWVCVPVAAPVSAANAPAAVPATPCEPMAAPVRAANVPAAMTALAIATTFVSTRPLVP